MRRITRLKLHQKPTGYVCAECRCASTLAAAGRWRKGEIWPRKELGSRVLTRGAKRKSVVTIDSQTIPQGSLPVVEPPKDVSEGPMYSITIQQHLNNMRKYPDCVVLTRMGNFYEMYFEQAEKFAPLLNLKLARKPTVRNAGGFVYMAGFPIHQKDRYLKMLVNDLGEHVAISEEQRHDESERMKSNGNMFDRKVVRIVTPGTVIDDNMLDPWENNFLLSVHASVGSEDVGLAWIDLSCGDFFTQKVQISNLASAIARIHPREVLVDDTMEHAKESRVMEIVRRGHYSISYRPSIDASYLDESKWLSGCEAVDGQIESRHFSEVERAAGSRILQYINNTQLEQEVKLQAPIPKLENDFMMIDKHSLRALEITETLRDGSFKGSLLQTVRRTATHSGARLLQQRLKAPSMSLVEIQERLDLVQEFRDYHALRDEITALLKGSADSLRVVSRFAIGRGEPDDLLGLSKTIAITAQIAEVLEEHVQSLGVEPDGPGAGNGIAHLQGLLSRLSLEGPSHLSNQIADAIDEAGLQHLHEVEDQQAADIFATAEELLEQAGEAKITGVPKGIKKASGPAKERDADLTSDVWIMRKGASKRLSLLHGELFGFLEEKDALEARWREMTGARKLSLKWMQPHGHVIHVTGVKDCAIDFSILGKIAQARSGKATRSLYHQDWTSLGNKIEKVKELIRLEEQRVFDTLRKQVIRNIVALRRNAAVLDELDVACGFALLAIEKNWVRPIVNSGTSHNIRGARHPTVEAGLLEQGKQFTSNDCIVGGDARVLLITGPNMGGKSTFLRQNALIAILAQTGSFIPAEYAEIGLVDKVFSRVGSADNLYQDQSTFMVEMLETAEILKQATPRSFVIMDEVGRGTTPEDGIAVGFASLAHLYHKNQCRALFATHFHVLADMTSGLERLKCMCTEVEENADGSFSYVHRLRQGVNRDPHALKVARLAGMPEEAIETAEKVLRQIKVLGGQSQGRYTAVVETKKSEQLAATG